MKKITKQLLLVPAAIAVMALAGCSYNPNDNARDANQGTGNTSDANRSVTDKATGAVGGAVETAGDAVKSGIEKGKDAVGTGKDAAVDAAGKAKDAAKNAAEKAKDAVSP